MNEAITRSSDFPACKAIYCVVPDDGTDKRILRELRDKFGIVRSGSTKIRGVGVLTPGGMSSSKLPKPVLVKELCLICTEEQAAEVFDYVFWSAQIDQPGRGVIWQQAVVGCTPYAFPDGMPDEDIES